MPHSRPLSSNATLVLQAVVGGHAYGFDVMDATGLASGIVYPLLRRLEARGLLRSDWEQGPSPSQLGRPRRRYYRATAAAERTSWLFGSSSASSRIFAITSLRNRLRTPALLSRSGRMPLMGVPRNRRAM